MYGKDGCKLRSEADIRTDTLYYFGREILFLSGKNERILKSDVYVNHDLSLV